MIGQKSKTNKIRLIHLYLTLKRPLTIPLMNSLKTNYLAMEYVYITWACYHDVVVFVYQSTIDVDFEFRHIGFMSSKILS